MKLTILLGLVLVAATLASINDQTLEEKAVGQEVTFASVTKIQNSFIFPDDFDFLKRIALVESNFGLSPSTFPPNFYGGIWQLSEYHYDMTKDTTTYPNLATAHAAITKKYKIDWLTTTWSDLLKPLHSGLAARLYLYTLGPVPQTLALQAAHWIKYYANEDSDTEADFISKMDLLVVLDESGSITQPSFTLALEFVAKLFGSYSLDNVRQGFMTFSTGNRYHFEIENGLSAAQIQTKVLTLDYAEGGTNTNTGILGAVNMFKKVQVERPGVPKIMTLFTDGQSTDGEGLSNVALLRAANITSFAIGISNYLEPELITIAYGDLSHVFKITDFTALTEFFHRLNTETCDIPQRPGLNETVEEEVVAKEKRIYEFGIPQNGINVLLQVDQGSVSTYYSYTVKSPSAALNDGSIQSGEMTYIHPSQSQTVYISVEGLEDVNKFVLMGFARIEAPEYGHGPCQVEGWSGHTNDCSLYHNCFVNEVGDLWDTIKQCPDGKVWCQSSLMCEVDSVCPCDIV